MRTNKLVHVLLVLATALECGKSDHIHLKIHVPTVVHKHRHIKTKLVHVFHPKIIHTDHSTIFHHRRDPSVGIINGGYSQPLVHMKPKPELKITEEEYNKWRELQYKKALDERKTLQEAHNDDEQEEEDYDDENDVKDDDTKSDLYKKHKANKANSTLGRKETSKHKNHNYHQHYEATNYEKTFANHPSQVDKKKQQRPAQSARKPAEAPRKKPQRFGFVRNPDNEAANTENSPQYYNFDQTASDPTFYSTIPKDQEAAASNNHDEIYSGLLSNRYDKKTVAKSKLLADINFNRKKQTKAIAASLARRSQ